MNLVKYTNRLLKLTVPLIRPVLKANKASLLMLLFLSILLGFIPSIKSGIESNFLNEANNIITDHDKGQSFTLEGVFKHVFPPQSTNDFLDNLPNYFTNHQTILTVVIIYLLALIVAFAFEYLAEKVKTGLGKQIFVAIREAAFKKALNINPGDSPKMLNSAGNFSSSIQIGTGNITSVYDFLADTVQYFFY